jgi:glutathione peroxidase
MPQTTLIALGGLALMCVASMARAQDSARERPATRPAPAAQPSSALDFSAKDIDGRPVELSRYRGKVLLIVNTASNCGYTPQYANLQRLYSDYKDKGLAILAFPANEFGAQEPGSNEQIKEFCNTRFHTTFDLFSKIVVKGDGQHPLYQFLTSKSANPDFGGEIRWNFTKFLISRDGRVVARYEPKVEPDDADVTKAIEAELARKS